MYSFSYTDAKTKLIGMAREQLPENFQPHAATIVDLHLRDDALAMPDMSEEDYQAIRTAILDRADVNALPNLLNLEETSTRAGMFRVLARTHLNRQGLGRVTKYAVDKTRSPRIMGALALWDLENPIAEPENQKLFLEQWIAFAERHSQDETERALHYSGEAINTLRIIFDRCETVNLVGTEFSARRLQLNHGGDVSWWKIALGLLSGLSFLQMRRWDCFERTQDRALQPIDILTLISECNRNVKEFGDALAGSFYGDLGGTQFVKLDTHVIASLSVLGYAQNSNADKIQSLMNIGTANGQSPRILDKLLYFACSGNFPLVDLKLQRPRQAKEEFLNWLNLNKRPL